jgi:hypothetical protein
MQRIFEASKNLDDTAFQAFMAALCKLSSAMVGMQSSMEEETAPEMTGLSPVKAETVHRRRVSGIHLPKTLRSGDFGLNKIRDVSLVNMHRLVYRDPEVAWNTTTPHLISVINLTSAPPPIRIQAAQVLDEILVVVPRNLSSSASDMQANVQGRVLFVLSKQVILNDPSGGAVELRKMGLETLHEILQGSGHTLLTGWELIFDMLSSACLPPSGIESPFFPITSPTSPKPKRRPPPLGFPQDKNYTALVKVAFECLKLVCDSMSTLSSAHLRMCISTLGQFGRHADTNIALTAAESLLWSISDTIQAKRKDTSRETEYSELWMFLLLEVLGLCTDGRLEVRKGAIQTLFRTIELYGPTLSADTWDECVWKIMDGTIPRS